MKSTWDSDFSVYINKALFGIAMLCYYHLWQLLCSNSRIERLEQRLSMTIITWHTSHSGTIMTSQVVSTMCMTVPRHFLASASP
jgi:hypothetical protein